MTETHPGAPNAGAHPYSAALLMRPESAPQAQQRVAEWLGQEVLLHDPLPALYPYIQTFTPYGGGEPVRRVGFLALVHVARTRIFPHESVLEASLPLRVAALRASGLQTIPTHGLYEDPERLLERMIEANLGYPLAEVVDAEGVRHTLGRFTDLMLIQRCQDVLRDRPVFLADGHHRFESFLRFRQEWIDQNGEPPEDHPVNFHLMYLSNFCGADLRIRPFHRVLNMPEGVTPQMLRQGIDPWFEVLPADGRTPPYQEMRQNPGAIGMVLGGKLFFLRPRFSPDKMAERVTLPDPLPVRRLAYTWVHYLILDRVLGIPLAQQAVWQGIQYHKSMGAAIKEAQARPGALCFLMPEVSPQEMMAVCISGARMPQKSTYFYPKVNGGMLFSNLGTF